MDTSQDNIKTTNGITKSSGLSTSELVIGGTLIAGLGGLGIIATCLLVLFSLLAAPITLIFIILVCAGDKKK